jgi:hypothetical protein
MSMKVIQPNCRVRFTAEDVEFVVSVLGPRTGSAESLVKLLADEETRDLILDDESLLRALLEQRRCLRVSTHFYFYVLVRHVFKRAGIDDRSVADYVAEVLAEYSRIENTRCVVPGRPEPLEYFFEMLTALQTADEHTRFYVQTHIGNHSLFLSGIFPERIRYRAERKGAPDLKYYEDKLPGRQRPSPGAKVSTGAGPGHPGGTFPRHAPGSQRTDRSAPVHRRRRISHEQVARSARQGGLNSFAAGLSKCAPFRQSSFSQRELGNTSYLG